MKERKVAIPVEPQTVEKGLLVIMEEPLQRDETQNIPIPFPVAKLA